MKSEREREREKECFKEEGNTEPQKLKDKEKILPEPN